MNNKSNLISAFIKLIRRLINKLLLKMNKKEVYKFKSNLTITDVSEICTWIEGISVSPSITEFVQLIKLSLSKGKKTIKVTHDEFVALEKKVAQLEQDLKTHGQHLLNLSAKDQDIVQSGYNAVAAFMGQLSNAIKDQSADKDVVDSFKEITDLIHLLNNLDVYLEYGGTDVFSDGNESTDEILEKLLVISESVDILAESQISKYKHSWEYRGGEARCVNSACMLAHPHYLQPDGRVTKTPTGRNSDTLDYSESTLADSIFESLSSFDQDNGRSLAQVPGDSHTSDVYHFSYEDLPQSAKKMVNDAQTMFLANLSQFMRSNFNMVSYLKAYISSADVFGMIGKGEKSGLFQTESILMGIGISKMIPLKLPVISNPEPVDISPLVGMAFRVTKENFEKAYSRDGVILTLKVQPGGSSVQLVIAGTLPSRTADDLWAAFGEGSEYMVELVAGSHEKINITTKDLPEKSKEFFTKTLYPEITKQLVARFKSSPDLQPYLGKLSTLAKPDLRGTVGSGTSETWLCTFTGVVDSALVPILRKTVQSACSDLNGGMVLKGQPFKVSMHAGSSDGCDLRIQFEPSGTREIWNAVNGSSSETAPEVEVQESTFVEGSKLPTEKQKPRGSQTSTDKIDKGGKDISAIGSQTMIEPDDDSKHSYGGSPGRRSTGGSSGEIQGIRKSKETIGSLGRSIISGQGKVNRNILDTLTNLINKNGLVKRWAPAYSQIKLSSLSSSSPLDFEFVPPNKEFDTDFIDRFVNGKETISGFLSRSDTINLRISEKFFRKLSKGDQLTKTMEAAVKYYGHGMNLISEEIMYEVFRMGTPMKKLIVSTPLKGLITFPLSLLMLFESIDPSKPTFGPDSEMVSTVKKFLRTIAKAPKGTEKEQRQLVKDLREMVTKVSKVATFVERSFQQFPDAMEQFLASNYRDQIKVSTELWINEQCEPTGVYFEATRVKVKRLKKIPRDLVSYILIEGDAIRDANDKMMIVSYAWGKEEIISWYIELLETDTKRYIVPHSKQYLEEVHRDLLAAIKKIMAKPIPSSSDPMIIQYPAGYEG